MLSVFLVELFIILCKILHLQIPNFCISENVLFLVFAFSNPKTGCRKIDMGWSKIVFKN